MKLKALLERLASLRDQDREVLVLLDGTDIEIIVQGDPEVLSLFSTYFSGRKDIET